MKLFIKLLIFLVILAFAAPFLMKKDDGTPWLTVHEVKRYFQESTTSMADSVPALNKEPTEFYKWKDAEGKWHFSDKPHDKYSSIKTTANTHVIRMKDIELPDNLKDEEDRKDSTSSEGTSFPLTTAPLEKVPEMLEKIDDFQKKQDERQKILDEL